MLLNLCLIIWLPFLLAEETCTHTNSSRYPNEESFIQMVVSNITASENYIFPVNNEKLAYVSPSERDKTHDYGTFDFVIVGGGTAGTVLANRLTEIENWNVLLLEAGGPENDFSDIPGMGVELLYSDMNWGYNTTSQNTSCVVMWDRMCEFPRGKVLGGSSTINGKFYARGHRVDYDNWERLGNDGWSFKEILPYFIKSENSHISDGDPGYHGKGGYLDVSYIEPTIFTQLYLNAMKDLGYETIDYNGRKHIGASRIQFTINGTKIASGGRAFIQPVICRNNLNVTFNAFVTKLLINNNDKSAYGVQFTKDGKIYTVNASKEVILSAGAVNTPQILMVSGIGPKEELDKIEVDTLLDLPVGRYMQDHPFFSGINVRTNVTLFNESLPNLISAYLRGHRPLTSPANMDTTGFFNVNDRNSTFPDIQHIVFVPPAIGRQAHVNTSYVQKDINKYSDVLLGIILLHPKSRGSITLKSKNPIDFPNADYNFFTDPEEIDISTMYKGILETLRLLETAPFKSVNATYIPYVKICTEFPEQSKEYWYCAIRYLTSTIYHPVGTTKMGISPRNSVVSSKLVVHGMKKLRIVDAGVMPEIPSANTMAPTYMIAEKAADLIKNCYQTV